MKTQILGFPRIGAKRELKKALEGYWKHTISEKELEQVAKSIRKENWLFQKEQGVDFIPSNDFSYYDQMLDASLIYGVVPERYQEIVNKDALNNVYFAMARGLQNNDYDLRALEMTKWFNTNYHYLVPEFVKDQEFELLSNKPVVEFQEALELGVKTKPVLISPVTYLLLGKEKEEGFHKIELLDQLLPVFLQLLEQLEAAGAEYIQIDEPCLSLDLKAEEQQAIAKLYKAIAEAFPDLKIILASYFGNYEDNLDLVLSLPVQVLHLDLCEGAQQLKKVVDSKCLNDNLILSLGVVNGRNIWKNNFQNSLEIISQVQNQIGANRVWIASSCSLLHSPIDLKLENNEASLPAEVKQWLAFAKEKVTEVVVLKKMATNVVTEDVLAILNENIEAQQNRLVSSLIHHKPTKERVSKLTKADGKRQSVFLERQKIQKAALQLPLFPTTTIGSFPQTKQVRSWRGKHKKGLLSQQEYNTLLQKETEETIRFQEAIDLDVLVHGEFERNDMVEYFGEQLEGFAFSNYGWVQSYGSRCVKPPIIYGDVYRSSPMTVKWAKFAQSLTQKYVKGMLTGPVTILQWSFVRDDQPNSDTCNQIALAIRDEVVDLEKAGIQIIQIDEPAIREGLPLRKKEWQAYLDWAIESFRISASGVKDSTQIHTHMCYSEFNDIIASIAHMDADVITIETSRSEMELLDAFVDFKYPNEIGPGVYDIHSPRVPSLNEIESLLNKASQVLPVENIWVNPDCGLKTRDWPETKQALLKLVEAAKKARLKVLELQQ